jgi:hypothetical protein
MNRQRDSTKQVDPDDLRSSTTTNLFPKLLKILKEALDVPQHPYLLYRYWTLLATFAVYVKYTLLCQILPYVFKT